MKILFSLKQQIRKALISIMAIIVLLAGLLLLVSINNYNRENDERRTADIKTYAQTIDDSVLHLKNVLGNVYSTNPYFQSMDTLHSQKEECDLYQALMSMLQLEVRADQSLKGLFIYYDYFEKVMYYVNKQISFEDKETVKKEGSIRLTASNTNYTDGIVVGRDGIYYTQYMKMSSAAIGGMVQLDNGLPKISETGACCGVVCNGTLYLTAGGDSYVENDDASGDGKADLEKEVLSIGTSSGKYQTAHYIMYVYPSANTDMIVVEILPKSLWVYVSPLHIMMLFLILLLVVVCIRMNRLITEELTRPLEDMTQALEQIRKRLQREAENRQEAIDGEEIPWKLHFEVPNRISEIEEVKDTVSLLLEEVEHYRIRSYEEQIQRQHTELQFYQLQLSPHFYTNCLKNAYYMMAIKEYDNVESFLLCLSAHLRYLLKKDRPLVTVAEEKEFLENYIELQNVLVSCPILCEMDIEESALMCQIPILSMQTFVENAVKYARDGQNEKLMVRIRIRLRRTEEGQFLDLTIRDNGPGYPEEILNLINQREPVTEERMGVGIINLESRLRLAWGDRANWYFQNLEGAVSELIIPVDDSETN